MATVEFIHFCDHAFLDNHGLPCLLGVHWSLKAESFPMSVGQLVVAIAIKLKAGEATTIRAEIGPSDGKPHRPSTFKIEGPPIDGPLKEGLHFLPFTNMVLFFKRPHVMRTRVFEGDTILAERTLEIVLVPTTSQKTVPR